MKHQAIQRYRYHKWANNKILDHLEELPSELYEKEIKSVFSSISEVIAHIYQVDGMWLKVMSEDPLEEVMKAVNELQEESRDKSLDQMLELYVNLSKKYESFLDEQEDLDRMITIEHPTYGKLDVTLANLVEHVVNHGTYHRGNITAMLRQQGSAGVPTDYIFYLHELSQ